jgi:RHH-type proline utilization regulon transcriptional repressor/proline dehydrogenase/delta 1-pyrroline-5-carboxylate dehydrogenase
MLCDAVSSMKVGSAWLLHTKLGPLNSPPSGDLEVALKELEEKETWAVMPEQIDNNPHLYSPGIKWGVQPGSYTHMTEFFGPVLGVMRAKDIYEAVDLVNQTGFGLTSGLESLDEREQEIWLNGIRAGNLYLNRVTTGAIVQRQPFGGMGKSAFGPGIKAGGPNYVAQLMSFSEQADVSAGLVDAPADVELEILKNQLGDYFCEDSRLCSKIARAMRSYERHQREELSRQHDDVRLVGQDNFRRYRPVEMLRVRIHLKDTAFDVLARIIAAKTVGCRTTVSYSEDCSMELITNLDEWTKDWGASIEFVEESDDVLAALITKHQTDRIRYADPERIPEIIHRAAGPEGVYLAATPPTSEGRVELLWYVYEQSISSDYHRYGNLGDRIHEPRNSPQ